MAEQQEDKGRRVTIDLSAGAANAVDSIRAATGLKTADVFRHALGLFRLYVDAKKQGVDIYTEDINGNRTRIEVVPVQVAEGHTRGTNQ